MTMVKGPPGHDSTVTTIDAELSGTAGIASFPAGVLAANNVSIAEVLRMAQENLILGSGTALPANMSLYGVLAGATGIAAFPAAAAPANDVSMAEVLRAIYDRQLGDGTDASTNTMLGKRVTRAAADLLNGATTSVYTVGTGRVLITALYGIVSVAAVDGTGNTLLFSSNPTVGTASNLSAASGDLTGKEIGTQVSLEGTVATALAIGASGGIPVMAYKGMVVSPGVIATISSVDAGTGGAVLALDLWYIPLDDGATVVTA